MVAALFSLACWVFICGNELFCVILWHNIKYHYGIFRTIHKEK